MALERVGLSTPLSCSIHALFDSEFVFMARLPFLFEYPSQSATRGGEFMPKLRSVFRLVASLADVLQAVPQGTVPGFLLLLRLKKSWVVRQLEIPKVNPVGIRARLDLPRRHARSDAVP